MKIKKLGILTICILIGLSTVACKKNTDKGMDSSSENVQSTLTDNNEENENNSSDKAQTIKLASYNDVVNWYKKYGGSIEKILSENNIDYYISNNKSFIASKEKTYTQFEQEYKQSLYGGTSIDFNEGSGKSFIEISKEFNKSVEATLKDPYIKTIADLYVLNVPNIDEQKFVEELSECISTTISTGEPCQINYMNNSKYSLITTQIEESTITLNASFYESFTITPKEVITKEYKTIKDFDAVEDTLTDFSYDNPVNKYEHVKVNKADKNNMTQYTIDYDRNDSDSFSETLGFRFGGFTDIDSYDEYSGEYADFKFTDTMKADFNKLVDVLSKLIELDVNKYMTNEQLMNEIQARIIAYSLEYEDVFKDSLPIPGADFAFTRIITFDSSEYSIIYADPEDLDIWNHLYDSSVVDPYEGRGYYEIGIDINRPVIAEGITSK